MLKSLCSAFLMYSRIPVPKVEWKEENRRCALGFFPLIGAVIGGLLILWRIFCDRLGIAQFLFAAGAVFLPVLVTGGIHLDGFCDVCDARASYADKAKRLEIMSDPHIGSFAVIRLCLYLIMQTALFTQIKTVRAAAVIACGYVLSRALSGLTAVTFKSAKSEGTLRSFVRPSHKNITVAMEAFFITLSTASAVFLMPVEGLSAAAAAVLVLLWHRYTSYRDFGGITGDLCGWFLQVCEIAMLAAAVFAERLCQL
ncbi:adenosylcobinamide-GDP ribazoletransferase [Ruminococcus flavefaciens]|uniref:adenosylcobinamide-GDP ribazoletransferase n=1 Tax=Ruminococcus flavefaciens TaxID=1265 RepID=UPI000463785D|nr:adenosylcobinamide-GDP ribazoletransferase [Ruminococcus flavefaciens]